MYESDPFLRAVPIIDFSLRAIAKKTAKCRSVHIRVKDCLFLLMLLTLLTQSLVNFLLGKAQPTPTIFVDPALTSTQIDNSFSIKINVSQVEDLCSWQAYIYFLKQIIEATNYAEGSFLKDHGPTMFDGSINNDYNTTHGRMWMYALRTWNGTGVDGSGTLGTVTFKAKNGGSTYLDLQNTILGNSTAQRIDHIIEDGTVQVGKHDVAIKNVAPLKTIVNQGLRMRIEVTAENQGNYTETFNVTAYANTTKIATQEVTLSSETNTKLTLAWNTTGFAKGIYVISASAAQVQYEMDTADNNMTDSTVRVNMQGDLNSDGTVDVFDIVIIAAAFGSQPGQPNWNPVADVNDDSNVDIFDLVIVAANFGLVDP